MITRGFEITLYRNKHERLTLDDVALHAGMHPSLMRELSSRTGALVTRGAYNTNPQLAEEFRLLIGRHPSVSSGA
ncbi:MAG TPA: hypothetical protein VFB14_22000 [Bryobacteraceae bacterium]|jgi:predicted transcriptional regulator of viral defense system|nr:hypothetical protein [Bryobacteraceae bacterium]